MMIGRNAIFGIGNPTDMIGSKNQRTILLRAIIAPSATPPTAAIAKPVKARNIVTPRLCQSSPRDGVGVNALVRPPKTAAA